jgi:hypothetical protein
VSSSSAQCSFVGSAVCVAAAVARKCRGAGYHEPGRAAGAPCFAFLFSCLAMPCHAVLPSEAASRFDTQMLQAQLEDAATDAADVATAAAGEALVSLGEAAGDAAGQAVVALGHAAVDAGAAAAPVIVEALQAAAPVVGEAAKTAAGFAFEGVKAAAPVVGQGIVMAGNAAVEVTKAAAPVVLDATGRVASAVGEVVLEGARTAWNSAVTSQQGGQQGGGLDALMMGASAGGQWVPLCCSTNSCLQGPAACGAPQPTP